MTILAATGDIARFENPKTLASNSGLMLGLEQSGVKVRGKGIAKEGRRELGNPWDVRLAMEEWEERRRGRVRMK